jgi:hypothetical protein
MSLLNIKLHILRRKTMTTETTELTNNTSLTVTDLIVLRNVIDLAASRGAFRANELTSVGEVFDKLALFVDTVVKLAEEAEEASTRDEESSDEEVSE